MSRGGVPRSGAGPVRTCVGCGLRRPQGDLQRFHLRDGTLEAGAGAGRGAYTCRRGACLERALARRAFGRTLRAPVAVPPGFADLFD